MEMGILEQDRSLVNIPALSPMLFLMEGSSFPAHSSLQMSCDRELRSALKDPAEGKFHGNLH